MKNRYFFALFRTLVLVLSLSVTSCDEFDFDNSFGDFNKQENDTTSFALYQIAENSLSGWDEGFFYSNKDGSNCPYYIVSSTDSINGDIIVCLNQTDNTDVNKSLTFHFSKEGDVLGVLLPGYRLDAQSYEEKVDFIAYDVQGKAQGAFSVPYIKVDTLSMSMTRSPFFNSKGNSSVSKILKFAEFGEKVTNVLGNVYNLSEGDYGEVVADFLLGYMTGAVKSFFGRIFAPLVIKEILEWHYEEAKRGFMGNADIQISSVKRTSKTSITVEGKISNISSIPSNRLVVADGQMGYTSNKIFYGVAVGKNAYPGLYLNENCTNLRMVSEEAFSFTFYMEETPGEVFYFRPFLIPETKIQHEDDLLPDFATCIRYGEAKKFIDSNVELSNFEQVKCIKNGSKYNVQFTIDASIPGLFDDLANWGFDVKTKSGNYEKRYYSNDVNVTGTYIPPTQKSFTCDVEIIESDIEYLNDERLSEITITPFIAYMNSLPSMTFFDEEKYHLTITDNICPDNNHPHAIDLGLPSGTKWCCMNVGASSPEQYGGYYAWGETSEKSVYNEVTYSYFNGQDTDGDGDIDKNFSVVNIGSDIAGTSYDVAHVRMGGSWRMPSFAQQQELMKNCTRTFTQQNGVYGTLVTGKNGGQLFLPAAGYRSRSDLHDARYDAYYWSSSLHPGSDGYACRLDLHSGYWDWNYYYGRSYGHSVRAVCP